MLVDNNNKNEAFSNMNIYLNFLLQDRFSIYTASALFPTVGDIRKSIHDPLYMPCFKKSNSDQTIGYRGYASDIVDFETSLNPFPGLNLWILIYDLSAGFKFFFVRVESDLEIGTKHFNLLHRITNNDATIIMAGEMYYITEGVSVPSMIWNFSSGTLTSRIYGDEKFLLKMLHYIVDVPLPEDIHNPFINLQEITQKLFMEIGYNLSIKKLLNEFIVDYEPIIIENFIASVLLKTVLPLMTNNEISHLFQFIDIANPNMRNSLPNLINQVDYVKAPIEKYAPYVCKTKPNTRNHLYIFPDKATCKAELPNLETEPAKYCNYSQFDS